MHPRLITGHPRGPADIYRVGLDVVSSFWCADDVPAGACSLIPDRGPAGLGLIQATGGNQPICVDGAINGKKAIVGDGIAQYMQTNTFNGAATNANFYLTASQDDPIVGSVFLFSFGGTATTNVHSIKRSNSGGISRPNLITNNVGCLDSAHVFNGVHLIEGEFTPTTQFGRFDGTDFTAGLVSAAVTIGTARYFLFVNNAAVSALWTGKFRMAVATRGNETLEQRYLIQGILAWDAGIAGLLPTGHPWKLIQP